MIDLYSDTVTRPCARMREAMAQAEVGDEQRGEDPTTRQLEERSAELLGQEAALFLPSATMANAIALQLHTGPGDEVLSAENGHLVNFEAGGAAVHARATVRSIPTWTGIFGPNAILSRLRPDIAHAPHPRLVVVENTTNLGGGRPWPLEELDGVVAVAHEHGLATHLDGSRLLNASTAMGVSPARLSSGFDSVTLCLSKGLGCPVGAILAFPQNRYHQARRLKQLMGGALRQSGILAAAGLFALENNLADLLQDHRKAARLAEGLSEIDHLVVEQIPERTNMVYFELPARHCPDHFEQQCTQHGLRVSRISNRRFRAVTHRDISEAQIEQAIEILRRICSRLAPLSLVEP